MDFSLWLFVDYTFLWNLVGCTDGPGSGRRRGWLREQGEGLFVFTRTREINIDNIYRGLRAICRLTRLKGLKLCRAVGGSRVKFVLTVRQINFFFSGICKNIKYTTVYFMNQSRATVDFSLIKYGYRSSWRIISRITRNYSNYADSWIEFENLENYV